MTDKKNLVPLKKFLDPGEEITGFLTNIKRDNGYLILTFVTKNDIAIHQTDSLEKKLNSLKGKHIGILATDFLIDPYRFRLIEKEGEVIKNDKKQHNDERD